jgi:hypothetical protein
VSAVRHASEAANGWTEVLDDQFGGKAMKPAKWGHRTPRPANLATLCAKTAEKRFRDFSDNSVTRVGGGVLQLDTRPVRRCRKGWEWVRANANISTRAPDAFAADGTYLFAARMKLPAKRGNFPAFWFRANDPADMGELDIVESFGRPRRRRPGASPRHRARRSRSSRRATSRAPDCSPTSTGTTTRAGSSAASASASCAGSASRSTTAGS